MAAHRAVAARPRPPDRRGLLPGAPGDGRRPAGRHDRRRRRLQLLSDEESRRARRRRRGRHERSRRWRNASSDCATAGRRSLPPPGARRQLAPRRNAGRGPPRAAAPSRRWTDRRRDLAARYRAALRRAGAVDLSRPKCDAGHVYHLFVVANSPTGRRCVTGPPQARASKRSCTTRSRFRTSRRWPRSLPRTARSRPRVRRNPCRCRCYPGMNDDDVDTVAAAVHGHPIGAILAGSRHGGDQTEDFPYRPASSVSPLPPRRPRPRCNSPCRAATSRSSPRTRRSGRFSRNGSGSARPRSSTASVSRGAADSGIAQHARAAGARHHPAIGQRVPLRTTHDARATSPPSRIILMPPSRAAAARRSPAPPPSARNGRPLQQPFQRHAGRRPAERSSTAPRPRSPDLSACAAREPVSRAQRRQRRRNSPAPVAPAATPSDRRPQTGQPLPGAPFRAPRRRHARSPA